MQTLTLKSYLSTIFPLLKDCESFKGENDLLAELVCSPDNGAFFETYGENSQAKTLSKIKAGGMTKEHAKIFQGDQARITVKIHRIRFKDNLWLFYTSTLEEQQFTFQDIFPDLTDYFETKSALNQLTDCCSEFQKLYLERIEKQYKVSPQDIQHFIEYLPEGLKEVSPSIVDLYVKLFTDHPEYAEYILTDADLPLFIYKPEEYRDYCIKMLDSIPSYQEITHFLKRVEEHEKKYPYSFHERRKSYGVPFLDI